MAFFCRAQILTQTAYQMVDAVQNDMFNLKRAIAQIDDGIIELKHL